jgi:hypothetical protein
MKKRKNDKMINRKIMKKPPRATPLGPASGPFTPKKNPAAIGETLNLPWEIT